MPARHGNVPPAPFPEMDSVVLVGYGAIADSVARLFTREDFLLTFPLAVSGWAPLQDAQDRETAGLIPAFLKDLPAFPGLEALFAATPKVVLILDLSDDGRHATRIRALAPPQASILTAAFLVQITSAADAGRLNIDSGKGLRKAKNLLHMLMDQMEEDDVFLLDAQGIIREMNRFSAQSRGMRLQDCIGRYCGDLDPHLFGAEGEESCAFLQARSTGKKAEGMISDVLSDGRIRYLHTLCFPLPGADEEVAQFLYIRRDVTERRQMAKRLQQAERLAAIGELSTYVAHEIRNPLFSIGGFANALLRHPGLDGEAREKARIIFTESRRLDVIVSNIINFARPTRQEMGVFEVEAVIQQTLALMTLGGEERGIRAEAVLEAGLPKVVGNAENLKQCLINLVKNSLEAMPEGGSLVIRCLRDKDAVRICVEDTGKGIPAEIQGRIFNPFFSTKDSGAGLGLAMTRKIIDEMGGKLSLKSKVGQGTTITLLLPAALAVDNGGPRVL
ncbi:MAG: PAS domain-containing protein [Desulfovibrio sp.]|nr:PAS domain-containing protein [Desulfovibrio sp.]